MSRASKSRAEKGRAPSVPAQLPPPNHSPDVVIDIIPGRLTQAGWLSMQRQDEGEEVVVEILNELLGHVMDRCYDVYLQNQLVPFTVAKVRDVLVHIVEWNFLNQDKGERPKNAPTWTEDSEPLPSTTECWAQGSVSVKYATAPTHPVQRTPAPPVTKKTDRLSTQRSWMTSHPSTSPKFSRNPRQSREPPGYRGYKLPPDPLLKNDEPMKNLPESSKRTPMLDHLQSSLRSGRDSVEEEEETEGGGEERMSDGSYLKLSRRHEVSPAMPRVDPARLPCSRVWPQYEVVDTGPSKQPPRRTRELPAMPRVDPAHLPGSRVWPQYEVVDTGPSKQPPRRTRELPAMPGGRKPDRQHVKHAPELKPIISSRAPSKVQRNDVSRAVWLSLKEGDILAGGSSGGIIPFSGTLMLDTMELAPGVSLKGPQGTRSRPRKGHPVQLELRESRPIRTNVPLPVFP